IESLVQRDRVIIITGLAVVAGLSWVYMFYLASNMSMPADAGMTSPKMGGWTPADFGLMFLMWAVMMVAMMIPSAMPMILLFASVNRKRKEWQGPYVPTAVFVSGYLLVWTAFSLAASVAQWGFQAASLLSPMMATTSVLVGGGILVVAGLYQWSSLKQACLKECRTPLSFLMTEWREGHGGAVKMGVRHGVFCVGCCWALMAILFAVGVMNLLWLGVITAFVLVEKAFPGRSAGLWISRISGVALVAWGVWTASGAVA
ncbi:MAG: DUF2182 domain-containing protein, partial [Chloroflexota bacterium]